jgi:transposase
MQKYNISFKGQNIFVGIDVHCRTWEVAVLTESGHLRRYSQESSAKVLFDFLRKNYPEGHYKAVYESGFSGYSTYYALQEYNIDCIIVHAADVPSTQYENVMKTDRIDAAKLARALKKGDILRPVYIRERDNIDDRAVLRLRKTMQRQLATNKTRVKFLLHNNGIKIPDRFCKRNSYWSKAFIAWLQNDVKLLSSTRVSLDLLIKQVLMLRNMLLEASRELRKLSMSDRYQHKYELLLTIPGIGPHVAMAILTEIYDVTRFSNERKFAHYLSLIPTSHNSGEHISNGVKTFRGNKHLGPMIIESSWVSVQKDIGIGAYYACQLKRMKPQMAIVKVARKLSNIIYSVLKNDTPYKPYKMDS